MLFRVLGALRVEGEAGPLPLGGPMPRAVLVMLLLRSNEAVSGERLAIGLWGEDVPAQAAKTVQVHVSRLRKALGEQERLSTRPEGYVLHVAPGELDLDRFTRGLAEGRAALAAGDALRAAALLRGALGLWRGRPLADLAEMPFAAGEIERLEEQRLSALERRIEADLALGRPDDLIAELRQLVIEHPFRERLHHHLMLALYRGGRQADALDAYRAAHRLLADELGVGPGPELRELSQAILRHDARLAAPDSKPRCVRHNLPATRTSFVGRAEELVAVAQGLERSRLVTICGPGGAGKTRLALRAAATVLEGMPDGVWLAALGPVASPEAVLSVAASALQIQKVSEQAPLRGLAEAVRERTLMLILDNCEHVVEGAAELADALLEHAPGISILATSRTPLRVRGERLLRLESLTADDAAALFADRAELVCNDFTLSAGNADAVHDICRRLDRLPLAVELTAAHADEFGPHEILRRLDDRAALLATGLRGGEARQRTLHATIDWSHALLTAEQQALLRRLAVFAGSFDRELVDEICAGPPLQDVAGALAALANSSLLVVEAHEERYRLLETIQAYAEERLRESDDEATVMRRHAEAFAARWQQTVERLYGSESRKAHDALALDLNDIRRALMRSDPAGDSAIGLAISLAAYSEARGGAGEAREGVQRTLAAAREHPPTAAVSELLFYATWLELWQDRLVAARELARENLDLCRALDEPRPLADALQGMAACWATDDPDLSRRCLDESVGISSTLGDTLKVARTLNAIGDLARARGRLRDAVGDYQAGLDAIGALPGSWLKATLLVNLGLSLTELGDTRAGRRLVLEAIEFARDARHYAMLAQALGGIAAGCAAEGDHERAARLLGAAAALWSDAGHPPEPADRRLPAYTREGARDVLGDEVFQQLFDQGRALSMSEAVELASSAVD